MSDEVPLTGQIIPIITESKTGRKAARKKPAIIDEEAKANVFVSLACDDKARLLDSVTVLNAKVRPAQKPEYERLQLLSGNYRTRSEAARIIFERHMKSHRC